MKQGSFSWRVLAYVGLLVSVGGGFCFLLPVFAFAQTPNSGVEAPAPRWKKVRYIVIPGEDMPTPPPLPPKYRGKKPEAPPTTSPEVLTAAVRQLLSVVLPAEQYELISSEKLGPLSQGQTVLERLLEKQGELRVQVAVSIGLRAEATAINVKKKRGRRVYTVVEKGWKYTLVADVQDVPVNLGDAPAFRQSYTFPLGSDQAKIEQIVQRGRATVKRLSLDNLESVGERIAGYVQSSAKPEPEPVAAPPALPQVVEKKPALPPSPLALVRPQAADVEDPLLQVRRQQETVTFRPPWRPAFVLEAGYVLSARALTANGGAPVFPLTVGSGLGAFVSASGFSVGAELYPFAFSRSISRHVTGLGFRGRFGMPFWTDVLYVHRSKYDPMDPTRLDPSSPRVTTPYTHAGRSAEAAVFWRTSFFQKAWRPEFKLGAVYLHQASQLTPQQPTNVPIPVPSVAYHGVGGELAVDMWMSRWFHLEGGAVVGKMLELGDIASLQQYGYGSGWQWRAYGEAALQLSFFSIGARVTYDRREMAFNGTGQLALSLGGPVVTAATDEALTVQAFVAFRFSPLTTVKKWDDATLRTQMKR